MKDGGKLRVDKLNGHNFQLWKMKMEDYLYQKDLWKSLEGKTNKHGTKTNFDWEILDRKALGRIPLCLASVTFNITKVKMIEELMETLAKFYEKPSTSNKVFLMTCLFNMKMV